MALPEKKLPLIYYKTKEDYKAKMASMSSEELEEYNSFYLGFIEDTRELHSHGAVYKCNRSWDLDTVKNNATEFVTFAEMGDTVTINNQELGTITYKGIESNTFINITISYKDGESKRLECTSDNNGVSWYIEDVINLSFVKTSEVSKESEADSIVKRDWQGGIMADFFYGPETFYWALPSSPDELKEEADGILQEEISDLEEIREGASKGATSVQQEEVSEEVQPNTIPKRDSTGDIWTRGIVSEGHLYALPRTALANSGDEDFNLQEQIVDIDEIREGASAGNNSLPATLDYNEYTFTEKVTPEVKNDSATIRSIKGNTVVWNQLVNTDTTSVDLIAAHKYITNISGTISFQSPTSATTINVSGGTDKVTDLTQMFGVGNEPTTVEEFYAMVGTTELPTEYNEGEFVGFNANSLESIGRNLFDEEQMSSWPYISKVKDGWYGALGYFKDNILWEDKYNITPLCVYFDWSSDSSTTILIEAHYSDGSIENIIHTSRQGILIGKTSSSKKVVKLSISYYSNIYVTIHNICISYSTSLDGIYSKYKKDSIAISPLPQYGLNTVNAIYDEIANGKLIQRIGCVKLADLVWYYDSTNNRFYAKIENAKRVTNYPYGEYVNAINSGGYTNAIIGLGEDGDKLIAVNYNAYSANYIFLKNTSYTDVEALVSSLYGVWLYYELENPIITDAPLIFDYSAQFGGTEKFISDSITAPATVEIAYNYDARSNIESLKQAVENKADKATTLKGYGIIDDYYTDAEVDILLEEVREDVQKEYLPLTKVQTVTLLTASGNITKDVYNAMVTADVVKVLYGGSTGNPQYELTMSSKEKNNGSIAYSVMFFSTKESVFKSFSVVFAAPSSSSNAVSYQVTLANLAIGAATVSEEV
jgi:hypothetical protein